MSLCYDGQKWLMFTISSVAISMIVGLVLMQYAQGQTANLQTVLDYCIAHADRVAKGENVIQDLIKSGLIEDIGPWTCKDVAKEKQRIENVSIQQRYQECLDNFYRLHKEYVLAEKNLRESVCKEESK